MKKTTAAAISFHLNVLLLILEFLGIGGYYVIGALTHGMPFLPYFKYFTTLSNFLVGVAAACMLPYEFRRLKGKEVEPSTWLMVLKLAGTTAVAITITVVTCYLGPVFATVKEVLIGGNNTFLHGLCPILSIVTFVFFDGGTPLTKKQSWPALLPGGIYVLVYFAMNLLHVKGWSDFYNFNYHGHWRLAFVLLMLLNYLLVKMLRILHNKFCDTAM